MQMRVKQRQGIPELLKPVVPKKTTLPVLTNVLLKNGYLSATDGEIMVDVELPEAQGAVLLPYLDVVDLLKNIPGNTPMTIVGVKEHGNTKVSILAADTMVSYNIPSEKDYPTAGELDTKSEFSASGDAFIQGLKELSIYASRETSRPVLHGVTVLPGEEQAMWAGDGFRLAYRPLPPGIRLEREKSIIIPLEAVEVLCYVWGKSPRSPMEVREERGITEIIAAGRPMVVSVGKDKLRFGFGGVTVMCSRETGSPPNYLPLIPKELPHKATVPVESFQRALKSLGRIAAGAGQVIRLSWDSQTLTIAVAGSEGQAKVQVPATVEGGEGKIAFKLGYLLEYLEGKEAFVTIECSTPSSPALMGDGSRTRLILMPMFVGSDGGKPQPPTEPETPAEAKVANTPPAETVEAISEGARPKARRKRKVA